MSTLVPTEPAPARSGRSSMMVAIKLAEPTGQAQKVQTLSAWTTDSRTPPAMLVMSPHTATVAQTGRNPAEARSTAATASTSVAIAPAAASCSVTVSCRAAAAVCN
jgi:hypothetical protein